MKPSAVAPSAPPPMLTSPVPPWKLPWQAEQNVSMRFEVCSVEPVGGVGFVTL